MRFSMLRESLLRPLQSLVAISERKQTMPILANVLLELVDDKLILTSTSIEIELILSIPASDTSVLSGSKTTVSARKLLDICRAAPDGSSLEFYKEGDYLMVSVGKAKFKLVTLDAEAFPFVELDAENNFGTIKLQQKELRDLLDSTQFAMAQQDTRQYLNGTLFDIRSGTLYVVASDGHRLALNKIALPTCCELNLRIIVPRKSVLEIMRLLNDLEEDVTISITNNHVRLKSSNFIFTSKLIDSRYPEYERNIPRDGNKKIVVATLALRNALARVGILANDVYYGVQLTAHAATLSILTWNQEQEKAEEDVDVTYEGEEIVASFNINYLHDILQNIKSEHLVINLKDDVSSVLVQELEAGRNNLYLLMPLRL